MICIEDRRGFTENRFESRMPKRRVVRSRVISEVLTVPGKPENVVSARKFTAKVARKCGFSNEEIFGIKLAVSEAISNAMLHGSRNGNSGFIQVVYLFDQNKMRIIVIDEGAFKPRKTSLSYEAEGGRGLNLISSFMDYVSIHPSTSGTSITMIKNLYRPKTNCA